MTQYIIIEDERFAYEELKRMMQAVRPDYQLVGWAETVEQAVLLLRAGGVQLILVDICLSDGLSFEVFEQCPVHIPVIFTTAYDEYALKAFKMNSIDYLLKPIDEAALEAALGKYEHLQRLYPQMAAYKKLEADYLAQGVKRRFLVQVGDAYQCVDAGEVAFFYSEEKYTYLHLFSGRRYIVGYSLEQLEGMLDSHMFFRVSRGCIVHVRSIRKISKYFAGRLKPHLTPDCPHEVVVSRSRAADFLRWLDDVPGKDF